MNTEIQDKTEPVKTVEEALKFVGKGLASSTSVNFIRKALASGNTAKYEVTIKRTKKDGIMVNLQCVEYPQKISCLTLLRLD